MTKLIELENIEKIYKIAFATEFKALNDISFSVDKGEIVSIVGESGAGKSTIAKLILGFLKPDKGFVKFKGINIATMNKTKFSEYQRNIQLLFQDTYASFNPNKTMKKSLEEPLVINSNLTAFQRRQKLTNYLEKLQLPIEIFEKKPQALSGGELQRVAIIRTIMTNPKVLILDEPFSSVDDSNKKLISNYVQELKKQGLTLIIISHHLNSIIKIADKIVVLHNGKIVEQGSFQEILSSSDNYTRQLFKDNMDFHSKV